MSHSTSVCILDYGSGNVGSVHNMIRSLGVEVRVSNAERDIEAASHLLLPGVGAFDRSLARIRRTLPIALLEELVHRAGKPLLGICVGMQVMAARGTEGEESAGLDWIGGAVRRLDCPGARLPHIGWNTVRFSSDSFFHDAFPEDDDFYFVHSYAWETCAETSATTTYVNTFACAVERSNLFGVQFHPEKSQSAGKRLLNRFLEYPALA